MGREYRVGKKRGPGTTGDYLMAKYRRVSSQREGGSQRGKGKTSRALQNRAQERVANSDGVVGG